MKEDRKKEHEIINKFIEFIKNYHNIEIDSKYLIYGLTFTIAQLALDNAPNNEAIKGLMTDAIDEAIKEGKS